MFLQIPKDVQFDPTLILAKKQKTLIYRENLITAFLFRGDNFPFFRDKNDCQWWYPVITVIFHLGVLWSFSLYSTTMPWFFMTNMKNITYNTKEYPSYLIIFYINYLLRTDTSCHILVCISVRSQIKETCHISKSQKVCWSCSNSTDQETLQFIPSFFVYLKTSETKINVDMSNTMKHFLNVTSYKSCYMKHKMHKKKSFIVIQEAWHSTTALSIICYLVLIRREFCFCFFLMSLCLYVKRKSCILSTTRD